jgi:hypothetical protein
MRSEIASFLIINMDIYLLTILLIKLLAYPISLIENLSNSDKYESINLSSAFSDT